MLGYVLVQMLDCCFYIWAYISINIYIPSAATLYISFARARARAPYKFYLSGRIFALPDSERNDLYLQLDFVMRGNLLASL